MGNPIIGTMNQNRMAGLLQNMSQVKQMYRNFKALQNPQEFVNNAINQNPELKQILTECNGDYRSAFYNYANQMGVDGDKFINALS